MKNKYNNRYLSIPSKHGVLKQAIGTYIFPPATVHTTYLSIPPSLKFIKMV